MTSAKDRAIAGVDDAFERAVGELFKVLNMAGADQDAPARFGNGITKLVDARTKAMAIIDSHAWE